MKLNCNATIMVHLQKVNILKMHFLNLFKNDNGDS